VSLRWHISGVCTLSAAKVGCEDQHDEDMSLRLRCADCDDPTVLLRFRWADSAAATMISADGFDTSSVFLIEPTRKRWRSCVA